MRMPRRKKQAGEPVDPEMLCEVSEAQKQKFALMGYKPYQTESGKVKWLTDDQYLYKKIKHESPNPKLGSGKMYRGNRRHRSSLKLFLRIMWDNRFFVLVLIGLLILVLFINDILAFLDLLI
jgi:hypothetical protein